MSHLDLHTQVADRLVSSVVGDVASAGRRHPSLPLRPWELLQQEPKGEKREPIQVSLVRPENTEGA